MILTTGLSGVSPVPGLDSCGMALSGPGNGNDCHDFRGRMENPPPEFPVQYTVEGYGYGPNILAVKLSLAVLFAYCLVTLAHIAYSIWTGVSSSSWDSLPEIVALAIDSPAAGELNNTGAGVETIKAYRHSVRIAEVIEEGNPRGRLRLLFASTGRDNAASIEHDRAYE